jgi:uncharacterized membrane protein YkvA (DUF1232 family)
MRSRRRRGGPLGFFRSFNRLAYLPLATRAPTYGRLVVALLRDDRIPWSTKGVLAVAAGYLVSPIDFIPEFIPIIGVLDDVAVIILALDIFLESVPRPLLDEKLRELDIDPGELESDLRQVRRYVPKPIRRLALRLPDGLEAVGSAASRLGIDRRIREFVSSDRDRARRARPVGGRTRTGTSSATSSPRTASTARTRTPAAEEGAG